MTQEQLGVISRDIIFISRLGSYFLKVRGQKVKILKNGLQLNGKMILKQKADSFTMELVPETNTD